MPNPSRQGLEIAAPLFCQEFWGSGFLAAPVSDSALASCAGTLAACLLEQRLFIEEHLACGQGWRSSRPERLVVGQKWKFEAELLIRKALHWPRLHEVSAMNKFGFLLTCAMTLGLAACSGGDGAASDAGGGTGTDAGSGSDAGVTDASATKTDTGGSTPLPNPIANPSFETASAPGSAWISGADHWTASGYVGRHTNLTGVATDGTAVMRVGAGQSSNHEYCGTSLSYIAQPAVDLSHGSQLTFDWAARGTMTYTRSPADIVFSAGLQNTGDLWSKTFSPPSSGEWYIEQKGTATMTIPPGAPVGEFSISMQYTGAIGVTEPQCAFVYVDNIRVK